MQILVIHRLVTSASHAYIKRRVTKIIFRVFMRLLCIAVDETKTKLVGEQLIIWAARDVDTEEVLGFRCSFTRSSLDAELFLKEVLRYCENRPFFLVDKGPWYPDAFRNLGLEYRHEARRT
ncbi:MAG: hypothetical protein ACE5KU_01635 [Nitrososphaerales archaeon]